VVENLGELPGEVALMNPLFGRNKSGFTPNFVGVKCRGDLHGIERRELFVWLMGDFILGCIFKCPLKSHYDWGKCTEVSPAPILFISFFMRILMDPFLRIDSSLDGTLP